ncbi:MAG: PorV/PorQ family protein [Bacteroidota bacterium]
MKYSILFFLSFFSFSTLFAQAGSRTIITGFPHLALNTNPRTGGMGEVGVVSSPYYHDTGLRQNPAVLGRTQGAYGGRISHFPWLTNLAIPGLNVSDLGGFVSVGKRLGVEYHGRVLRLGLNQYPAYRNPKDQHHGIRLGWGITPAWSIGMGLTYVHSQGTNLPEAIPLKKWMGEVGLDYQRFIPSDLGDWYVNFGLAATNLGSKIAVGNNPNPSLFSPATLQSGLMIGIYPLPQGKGQMAYEASVQFSKLLVPSDITIDRSASLGALVSFWDAPGGLAEEWQEVIAQWGFETRKIWPSTVMLALRAGGFLEAVPKGNRRYFTSGVSVGWQQLRLDGSFSVPLPGASAVLRSWRLGLAYEVNIFSKK